MASQQQPRPWFRLASLAGRPPQQQPTTAPEPQATQPRPRPAFRPLGQTQPQEPGQQGYGVSSVPTSPIRRTSVPTSPVQRPVSPPKPQITAPTAPTASLQTSPIRRPVQPFGSVKTSPVRSTQFTTSVTTSPQRPRPYTASVTTSPVKSTQFTAPVTTSSPPKPAPYTGPVITSEPKPAPTTFSVPTATIRSRETVTQRGPSPPSPKRSPKIKTPVESPKQKHAAPPPSPLSLPPPQLRSRTEHEPRFPTEIGVLVEQTIEKPKSWPIIGPGPRREFEETHHRPAHHKKSHHLKKPSSDTDESGMRVITIAGENKGAFMEVTKSPLRGNNSHTLHKNGYTTTKTESDGSGWKSSSSSSDEEGKSKHQDKGKYGNSMASPHLGAFMNSNVQGINNSLVLNSSCSHHDPGVHLAFSRKPSAHGFQVMDDGHNQ